MELQPESIPRGNERILAVDQDQMMVISLRDILQTLGYQVTTLTDGQEALKVFSEKPSEFNLVIADHTIPQFDEIAQKMIRIRSDIPIIICSIGDTISPEEVMIRGFRGLLEKPFTLRKTAEVVRHVLEKPILLCSKCSRPNVLESGSADPKLLGA